MRVTLFPCGPAANESELKAFEHLKSRLQSEPGDEEWVLLTNLAFSVTHQLQSDEIDLVVIGPTGVRVIEVKHWTTQWFDAHRSDVEDEADRVTNKARKIGTTLRRGCPGSPPCGRCDPADARPIQGKAGCRPRSARRPIPYPERLEGCDRL